MSDSQLLPWIAEEGKSPQTEEIKDPISGASITLPRINGLTVNEVLFAQWAVDHYEFAEQGTVKLNPKAILELTQFCHRFLCLRLGLADWNGDTLVFSGAPRDPKDTLTMVGSDGQQKAATMHMLYLIWGFFIDEENRWMGKLNTQSMTKVSEILAQLIGEPSIASSEPNTQDGSQVGISPEPQLTPSSKRSKAHKNADLAA